MRGNIVESPPWSSGEVRALLLRHGVCFGAVLMLCAAVLVVGGAPHLQDPLRRSIESSSVTESLTRCRSELERFEHLRQWFAESELSRRYPSRVLYALERTLPAEVWLQELVVVESRITVMGIARSDSYLSTFIDAMRSVDGIEHLRLESSQAAEGASADVREFRVVGELGNRELQGEG
jgi:Tfp pilus assembly protein PilN